MKKTARPLMVQGTSSHVGKSILTAAIIRVLKNRGFRVAPFKAQNMALNSSVTEEGHEIGRAQALQAEAAGVSPTADMNPILLKPTADSLSQVIIHGKVYRMMSAVEYHGFKKEAARFVLESYSRLAGEYDIIVIEGAGSPAEINLRENDIANMGVAEMTDSPVILVGDIDRGGVFASIVGTMELLTEGERARVKGFIINKFRGDIKLLEPGVEFLEKRTGRPVLGVVPYIKDMALPDEDGVSLDGPAAKGVQDEIAIVVIKLPRISNFTDFDPFRFSPGVHLSFTEDPKEISNADMAIIPGTKNTLEDLLWLKGKGFDRALRDLRAGGGVIAGICGGFQMLGGAVKDPFGVESGMESVEGLGLLDTETVLMKDKKTFQVKGEVRGGEKVFDVTGYEIHMGETSGKGKRFARIKERNAGPVDIDDGCVSDDGSIWGTYIHGIFDNDPFRESIISGLKRRKGIDTRYAERSFREVRESSMQHIADIVEESLDMEGLLRIIGVGRI